MEHDIRLSRREWVDRGRRVDVAYGVLVQGPSGGVTAELLNISSDGFRVRSDAPLESGWEVTLKMGKDDPLKAVIVWACGLDAGGVFADPVAL